MRPQPLSCDSTATRWARQETATICSAKAFITLITHGAKQLPQPSEAFGARLETRWGGEASDESKQEVVLFFFLPLLHIISSAHQQLDKLEWWIWPLWIDTNTWSIKIPDSVPGLRKCATVKDKRRVSALNDIWSCGGKVWGSVFVVLLPAKMYKTLSADRLVLRKVAVKCHHLNAKLKPLHYLPPHTCNACFKGVHVQSD